MSCNTLEKPKDKTAFNTWSKGWLRQNGLWQTSRKPREWLMTTTRRHKSGGDRDLQPSTKYYLLKCESQNLRPLSLYIGSCLDVAMIKATQGTVMTTPRPCCQRCAQNYHRHRCARLASALKALLTATVTSNARQSIRSVECKKVSPAALQQRAATATLSSGNVSRFVCPPPL